MKISQLFCQNKRTTKKHYHSFSFVFLSASEISNPKGPIKSWHSFSFLFLSASEISNLKGPIARPFPLQNNLWKKDSTLQCTYSPTCSLNLWFLNIPNPTAFRSGPRLSCPSSETLFQPPLVWGLVQAARRLSYLPQLGISRAHSAEQSTCRGKWIVFPEICWHFVVCLGWLHGISRGRIVPGIWRIWNLEMGI